MDILRLLITAFVVVVLVFAGAVVFDPTRGQNAQSTIRAELQAATNSEDLTQLVETALNRDDIDEAAMYADIANFTGIPLASETEARLSGEDKETRKVSSGGGGFVDGFMTNEAASTTALGGAVASDLTMIGDIRDITIQGGRFMEGKPFDEMVLDLSVIGVGLTTASVTSSGVTLPAKVGVSILKVAKRAGTLSEPFTKYLNDLLYEAIDRGRLEAVLKATDMGDAIATRAAIERFARHANTASIFTILSKLRTMRDAAGAGETVRLLQYVRSPEDLDELATMTSVLGPKTRAVIELTRKTSLHHFKHAFNVVPVFLDNIGALAAWAASLLTMFFSRSVFRLIGA